ncbi:unnamed protein product [Adineta ricciae]|uniref:G-protein coupled receptors family 1 profile domain-containing protein n=1 Tax=Adineta ricciae TaxID=249248 RepID=A0A813T7L1_ADIRI|nr:unnamed protein product [Adineta ricciae]CAF1106220.1 unnamed protein product [Adineta ricciae]
MSNTSVFTDFTTQYNRIVPPTVFCIGVVGNIFNIITFSGYTLRTNPCTMYFFGLAMTHLNNLAFGLLFNYLGDAHHVDPLTASTVICRLRFFIVHCSIVLSSWFIVLAGIDRYFISSRKVNLRNLSSFKNILSLILAAISICFVLYAHVLFLFTIEQTKTGPVCYAQSGAYRVFYDFFFFTTYSCTPTILMIIIGLATLYNTIRRHDQINPTTVTQTSASAKQTHRLHKRDYHFIKMLLLELATTVLFTLPIVTQKLYATLTERTPKSSERLQMENFFAQLVRTLTQVNSAISFYM